MNQFEVGDLVKIIESTYWGLWRGDVGKYFLIEERDDDNYYLNEAWVTREVLEETVKLVQKGWGKENGKDIEDFERFHPRAVKLLKKKKQFIVVAFDEPYYLIVYFMIREHEISKGTWGRNDEAIFLQCLENYMKQEGEKDE